MPFGLGGTGWLGVGFETTYGTWITPTVWLPIRSESLQKQEDKIYRTNIRGVADRTGAIQGYYHIEGDIEFEVNADVLLYFLYLGRFLPAKSGAGPYVYTFTPTHIASPSTATGPATPKSGAVTIARNNRYFGYSGVNVARYSFRVEDGLMLCTASVIGLEETNQAGPFTPVYNSTTPFGPLYNRIEIPTATVRTDIDTFTLDIDDGGEAQNRIKTTGGRAAAFMKWGEREVTLSMEHDFDALTDYNTFLNKTVQSITFKGSVGASNEVSFVVAATVVDSYEVGLSSLGDLTRATVQYHGYYGATDVVTIVDKSVISIL